MGTLLFSLFDFIAILFLYINLNTEYEYGQNMADVATMPWSTVEKLVDSVNNSLKRTISDKDGSTIDVCILWLINILNVWLFKYFGDFCQMYDSSKYLVIFIYVSRCISNFTDIIGDY